MLRAHAMVLTTALLPELLRSGATLATPHAIMLRLRQRPLEMLGAHAMELATVLMSKLLGAGATLAAVHAFGLRLRQRPPKMLRARARVLTTVLMSELLGAGATLTAMHAIMRRLVHWLLKVLRAHARVLATVLMSELLRSGTAMLLKAGRRAARSAESQISTRTAELLRLLPSAKAMPHPALGASVPVHLPILRAALRRAETFTATRCAKSSTLGKRTRTTTFQTRPETTQLIATRP